MISTTVLLAGLVLIAVTEGYGALLKYWGDSSWSLNMTFGVLPPLLVAGLGIGLFQIGGALAGDAVHRPRAVLRVWWIAVLVVAGLMILAQVVELVTATESDYPAFDLIGVMVQVATAGVGTLGFVVGRNLRQPTPAALARAAAQHPLGRRTGGGR